MTSSLAAERQSGHSRPSKKQQHIFTGIEDPQYAALHIASVKGHPQAQSEVTLPCGEKVVFIKPNGTMTVESLRQELAAALSCHYKREIVTVLMEHPQVTPPAWMAKKLRNNRL